jgi:hypothetical protein
MIARTRRWVSIFFIGFFCLYFVGFFFLPPLIYATTFTSFRSIPLFIHDIMYAPILREMPENSAIRSLWFSNAEYWCKRFGERCRSVSE